MDTNRTFKDVRKDALELWTDNTKRVFKTTDNISESLECQWQRQAEFLGFNHVSIFCSIGQFSSHITDVLRDYRYDNYVYDQSLEINEVLFRYYSRLLLIASEIITDFQDLYLMANNLKTMKELKRIDRKKLKEEENKARLDLSFGNKDIINMLDYINKICKHKASNFHICNNHLGYIFKDSLNSNSSKKTITMGNINQFTSYDSETFYKYREPQDIEVPMLEEIILIILNSYAVINNLFYENENMFKFVCEIYETSQTE